MDEKLYFGFCCGEQFASSPESFENILNKFEGEIFRLALTVSGNKQNAEAILCEVFSQAYALLKSDTDPTTVRSWLYEATLSVWFSGKVSTESLQETEIVEQEEFSEDFRHGVELAVAGLPDDQRLVFTLCDIDGFTTAEVAELIERSDFEVNSILSGARLMICRFMQRYCNQIGAEKLFAIPPVATTTGKQKIDYCH